MLKTESELYKAVASNNLILVQQLTSKGFDLNQWRYDEWDEDYEEVLTAIEKAVQMNNKEILLVLLQTPIDPQKWKLKYIYDALHVAAHLGYLEIVQLLLRELGSWADSCILSSALIGAIWREKFLVAECLIKAGADVNYMSDEQTPLMVAAIKGNLILTKMLVEAGADVDLMSSESPYTGALGFAAINGHQEVVDYLFPLVSNVSEKEFAVKELKEIIKQKQTEETPEYQLLNNFFTAIYQKDINKVRELISGGVDVNICFNGVTPLHQAASMGDLVMIKTLVELGADVNIPNEVGETPLMLAVMQQEAWAIRLLLRLGADVEAKDFYGNSLMDIANSHPCGHPVIKKLLLRGS